MKVRRSQLSPRVSVRRSLLQGLVYSDHYLLRPVGAQTVSVIQGYVVHLHQPGPLAQLAQLAHVVGDAVYLSLVAVGNSTRA